MTYDGRLGEPEPILTGIGTSTHHNGGGLAFGPDGLLYAATGDAENPASAQDTDSVDGKVLRMTDAGRVPDGNPFDNLTWSFGHRNVEGIRFDDTGRLWIAEFGDKGADELNLIRPGKNYGWPDVEGSDGKGGYADPLAEWPVDQCSPSGIAIAAGRAWLGALQGECVWSVVLDGARTGEDAAALRRRVRPDPLGRPRPRRVAVGDHVQPGRPHRPACRRRPDPAGHAGRLPVS